MADVSATRQLVRQHALERTNLALGELVRVIVDDEPVRTGATRLGTHAEVTGVLEDLITAQAVVETSYAHFVDDGTQGPYVIQATHAKALRWQGPTGPVFAQFVVHPGIAPRHFFRQPMPERWAQALQVAFSG